MGSAPVGSLFGQGDFPPGDNFHAIRRKPPSGHRRAID